VHYIGFTILTYYDAVNKALKKTGSCMVLNWDCREGEREQLQGADAVVKATASVFWDDDGVLQ
jgi:hypothetical protein